MDVSDYPDFSSHGYQVTKELGCNREGGRITYQATAQNLDHQVVIKEFRFALTGANWSGFKAYQREIEMLQQLAHPRIPRYLDSFETQVGFCLDNYRFDFKKLVPKLNPRFISWLDKMVAPNVKQRFDNATAALDALKPMRVVGGANGVESLVGVVKDRRLQTLLGLTTLGIVTSWAGINSILYQTEVPQPEIAPLWEKQVRQVKQFKECVKCNLQGADLNDADLNGANLSGANLRGANLRSADLSGADLMSVDLWRADLRGTDLRGVALWSANLTDADLRSANLNHADLRSANLKGANLSSADLTLANLTGADLTDADLESADLTGANLTSASLEDANLKNAIMPDGSKHP